MNVIKHCKCCGQSFVGHTMTSLYCSKQCNQRMYKQRLKQKRLESVAQENAEDSSSGTPVYYGEFLNPTETSKMLGVSRATVYRYIESGFFKAVQLKRKTLIRRSDIDKAFDEAPPYKKRTDYSKKNKSCEYYTVREIVEKFHLCKKAVLNRCDRFSIPKVYEGRNVFFNKATVDLHFNELLEEIDLQNYYTIPQLIEKFNMSKQNVLAFVCQKKIPRVTRGRNVYYSKAHVDSYKRKDEDIDANWYSKAEIMEKYGLTIDRIGYYIRHEGIKTERRGRYTMIFRSDFDNKVINGRFGNIERDENGKLNLGSSKPTPVETWPGKNKPETPEGYYSAEDISRKYKVRLKRVYELAREHGLPRIGLHNYKFYEIAPVDELFGRNKIVEGVKEWIVGDEIDTEYGMSPVARRSFLHRHKIPYKVEFGKTYYSKTHIDKVKGLQFEGSEQYYSVKEAMEKYSLTKDTVFYIVKQYNITKVRCGRFAFINKEEFDKKMSDRASNHEFLGNSDS